MLLREETSIYAPKRTSLEKQKDMAKVAELYSRGFPISDILEIINEQYPPEKRISKRRIEADIQELTRKWQAESLRSISELRAEQLEKLRQVEQELWQAWEKSKEMREIITSELSTGGIEDAGAGGSRRKVQTRREQQVGDPRYLQGILEVVDRRTKLLGLNEPQKVQLSVIQEMKDDELENLIREISAEVQLPSGIIEGETREVGRGVGGGEETGA